jgi:hypothetical protein
MRPVLKSRQSPAPRRLALEALEPRLALARWAPSALDPIESDEHLTGVGLLPGGEVRWGGHTRSGGKLWDLAGGQVVREQAAEVPAGLTRAEVVAVSPNGRWAAAVQYDFDFTGENLTRYVVWDAEQNSEPQVIDLSAAITPYTPRIVDLSDAGVALVQIGVHAYRWDAAGGLVRLTTLYELEGHTSAESQEATVRAISADGRTIVGASGYTLPARPTVWTDQVPRELPTLGGAGGTSSVSADGHVIGGWVLDGAVRRAAVWVDGELIVLESDPSGIAPWEARAVVNGLGGDPQRWAAFGNAVPADSMSAQQAWIAYDGGPIQLLTRWLADNYEIDFFGGTMTTPWVLGNSASSGVMDAFIQDGKLHIAAHQWMAIGTTHSIPPSIFYAATSPRSFALVPLEAQPLDVNQSGEVSPIDALLVINALNEQAASGRIFVPRGRLDTSGDGQLTPLDALLVINYLNTHGHATEPPGFIQSERAIPIEAEGEFAADGGSIVRASDVRLHAADVHVGGDEERLAIVAELAVGGALARVEAADWLAFGSEAIDAAGAGGPEVPLLVDRHPVRRARTTFLGPPGRVEQDAAGAERAVGVDGEGLPDGGAGVGLGDVKRLLVRRKSDAVGARHLLGE